MFPQRVTAFVVSVSVLCLALGVGYASPALARTDGITEGPSQNWDPPKSTRKHPKIDSALLAIAQASLRGSSALAEAARGERVVLRDDKIRVLVESVGADTASARAAITAARGDVDAEYAGVIRAFVAPSALEGLAQHPAVRWIARPGLVIADGLVDEGVVASNASAWYSAGWDGRDVKIAIIDGGFIGYAAALLNGDLPMQTITQDFGCGGPELDVGVVSPHGTAVARIVHQMAPAAQLYLLCVDDPVGLGQAKDYAIASGVKIINQSLGWFNSGRGDGTGGAATVDGIVASARTAGILWVNSAGNQAQRHWSGTFTDFDADARHDFVVGDNLNDVVLTAGVEYCATLKWDAWPTTNMDYDLYLIRVSDNVIVDFSENFQTGTQPPVESLCFTSPTTTTYGLGIVKFSAATMPRFDLFSLDANLQYRTIPGSVGEPASSPSVMAVGAICWQNDTLESYSSQGPTIDGRIKPDIAGQDATSSDVYGAASGCAAGFLGTSASAPHVAGAAALALQANPTFTPAQLQSYLEGRAVDLLGAGKDNSTGWGKLWLGSAPLPTGATISATPSPVSAGNDLTISWTKTSQHLTDWVGLFPVGYPDGSYIAWRYTNGAASSSVPLTVPLSAAPGSYNVRLFHMSGNVSIATSAPITVNAPAAPTISATPTPINPGDALTVTWSTSVPTAGDWIGLFKENFPDGSYIAWRYTTGATSGSVPLTVPASAAAGTYNVRLFLNSGNTSVATSAAITVNALASGAALSATPSPIAAGNDLTVNWTNITSPTGGDWIGLFRADYPDSSYIAWRYTTGTANGSVTLTVPLSAGAGTYNVRLFLNSSNTAIAASPWITVTAAAATASVNASPSPINAGSDLTVTWNTTVPSPGDWIGLFPAAYPDSSYIAWRYTGGAANGSVSLTVPLSASAGTYNVRLFLNNSNTSVATSTAVTVNAAPSTATISASPSPITAGNDLTITFTGIAAPTGGDWIALQPVGYPDGSYIAWRFTGGTAGDTVTLTVPASAGAGAYNVRLFLNYSNTSTATSNDITVNAAPSSATISASPSPVTAGSDLTITFSDIAAPTGGDWIALQPVGYPDGSYIAWQFTGGTASGTVMLTVPLSAVPGSYNVRLFLNYSNSSTATSNSVTVN